MDIFDIQSKPPSDRSPLVQNGCPQRFSAPSTPTVSDFARSLENGRSTSDDVFRRIGRLKLHGDLWKGDIDGVSVKQFIRTLLNDTSCTDHTATKITAQRALVQEVADMIVNRTVRDGEACRTAHKGQVTAIQRLVYGHGDTILLARTGYGKSIIFQAVSVMLPDKVIIQIIPLSKLGEEQRDAIKAFPGCNPLITDALRKVCNTTPHSKQALIRTGEGLLG